MNTDIGAQVTILKHKDLRMDLSTFMVSRGQEEIYLTKTEFNLLKYLLQHQGRWLTQKEICRDIWHSEHQISLHILEDYIAYLTDKIDTPFGTKTIHYVKGRGYFVE